MKIEVGKTYRVTNGVSEGLLLKVTGKTHKYGSMRYEYEPLNSAMDIGRWFCAGSDFSRCLEPIEEETKGAKEMKETKVVILRDGNTVTAAQYIDGVKVNTGVAKCSPEDSFDFGTGAKLALERLFKSEKPLFYAHLKFDWDKFASGDLYVELNRKNMDGFLKECEERGYKWMSGELATERNLFRNYDKMPDGAKFIAAILGVAFNDKLFVRVLRGKLVVNNETLPDAEVCKW